MLIDENPAVVFTTLLRGAFGDMGRVAGTLLQTTPILISGVAACIALRGGMFNVGVEGQLFMGGFAAALVGFSFAMPTGLHMLVGLAAAIAAGAAWVAIPAYFRVRFNTNEVVSTILSNYVAVLLTSYFTIFLFKRPGGWSETPPILASAYLPELFSFSRLNWGLVIGLVLAVAVTWYFRNTPRRLCRLHDGLGAEIRRVWRRRHPQAQASGCSSSRVQSAALPEASRRSAFTTVSWRVLRPASASTA